MQPPPATALRLKLTGICAPARGVVIDELTRAHPSPVWLVVADELKTAEQLAEDIAFFHHFANDKRPLDVLTFPESMADNRDMREAFTASSDRLAVLSKLRATRTASASQSSPLAPQLLVVTTPAALLQPVPALEEFATREFTLTRGQTQPFQGLLEKLRELDYDSEAVCEAPGHYAIRGGIIDVYPVTANQPYRLDFFGDEIEEIRTFDPVTQRSADAVESLTLSATPRLRLDQSKTGLADYLSPRTHLVLLEPASLDESFSLLARENVSSPAPVSPESASSAFSLPNPRCPPSSKNAPPPSA